MCGYPGLKLDPNSNNISCFVLLNRVCTQLWPCHLTHGSRCIVIMPQYASARPALLLMPTVSAEGLNSTMGWGLHGLLMLVAPDICGWEDYDPQFVIHNWGNSSPFIEPLIIIKGLFVRRLGPLHGNTISRGCGAFFAMSNVAIWPVEEDQLLSAQVNPIWCRLFPWLSLTHMIAWYIIYGLWDYQSDFWFLEALYTSFHQCWCCLEDG
jgi:hypothetical protein